MRRRLALVLLAVANAPIFGQCSHTGTQLQEIQNLLCEARTLLADPSCDASTRKRKGALQTRALAAGGAMRDPTPLVEHSTQEPRQSPCQALDGGLQGSASPRRDARRRMRRRRLARDAPEVRRQAQGDDGTDAQRRAFLADELRRLEEEEAVAKKNASSVVTPCGTPWLWSVADAGGRSARRGRRGSRRQSRRSAAPTWSRATRRRGS